MTSSPASPIPDHPSELPDAQAVSDDALLLEKLRQGDEAAFMELVERYQGSMLRIASMYLEDRTVAEEVVQETWIAVLRGLNRFEGRAQLKTWIFSILVNRAKTQAQREGRYISTSLTDDEEADEPSVDPSRFRPAGDRYARHWVTLPTDWNAIPEEQLLSQEVRQVVQSAIDKLPDSQREVITLHDVDGLETDEVCSILGITEVNQRVLLHRARSAVRRAVESYLGEMNLTRT